MQPSRDPYIFDTEQQARAQAAVLNRMEFLYHGPWQANLAYSTGNEMGHWLITMWREDSNEFVGYWAP
jgi:hypothetical protein